MGTRLLHLANVLLFLVPHTLTSPGMARVHFGTLQCVLLQAARLNMHTPGIFARRVFAPLSLIQAFPFFFFLSLYVAPISSLPRMVYLPSYPLLTRPLRRDARATCMMSAECPALTKVMQTPRMLYCVCHDGLVCVGTMCRDGSHKGVRCCLFRCCVYFCMASAS